MHEPVKPTARGYLPAVKDVTCAHAIASAWRPVLHQVVRAFADGDFSLATGLAGVVPPDAATAAQVRDYLADYGCRLIELPDETWQTSAAQWMGTHWEVLVDLWTAEEGCSDLVLHARVTEVETELGFVLKLGLVYVP